MRPSSKSSDAPAPGPEPARPPARVEERRHDLGALSAFAYGDVPGERLVEWSALLAGSSAAARRADLETALKAGCVWRHGDLTMKLFEPSPQGRRWWPSRARRAARGHARIAPLRSPRPFAAFELAGEGAAGPSLLVSEHVAGRTLREAWPEDGEARSALAPWLVDLHRRGVLHGDFHTRNVLWNGAGFVLLELQGLRAPWRSLWPDKLLHRQWARLVRDLGGGPELRSAFEAWLVGTGVRWNGDRVWRTYCARAAGHGSTALAVRVGEGSPGVAGEPDAISSSSRTGPAGGWACRS